MTLTSCPVCSHPVNPSQHKCPECTWPLLPMLGISVEEANQRLARAREDWMVRQGKGLHQGAPDFSKSPFETSDEYEQRIKGYWHVAQGELLANDYDLNTQRLPVRLHTPQPWLASAKLCWPERSSFEIERLAAKALYTQNKHHAVYAQLQHSAQGVRLHDFQLHIRPGEHFSLAAEESPTSKRYRDNQDGTVTDLHTGLQWKRCSEGQTWNGSTCTGEPNKYTWKSATYLPRLFADHSDWRLPTIEELNTLVYCSNGKQRKFKWSGYFGIEHEGSVGCKSRTRGEYQSPTIDTQAFPYTSTEKYWSASPYKADADRAWGVYFGDGGDGCSDKGNAGSVRLVRGQSLVTA